MIVVYVCIMCFCLNCYVCALMFGFSDRYCSVLIIRIGVLVVWFAVRVVNNAFMCYDALIVLIYVLLINYN